MQMFLTRLHKWLALIVGLQLLIWLGTGIFFSVFMDTSTAATYQKNVQHEGYLPGVTLYPLHKLNAPAPLSMKLIWILGVPVYALDYAQPTHDYFVHNRLLFDARNGAPFEADSALIARVARLAYDGDASAKDPVLLHPPIADDVRQQNPVWQVAFNDERNTSIYFDKQSGHVVKHTNDNQRFNDLMFTLHFMDYAGTGHFNHWLIILFALVTCALSFSGGYLLLKRAGNHPRVTSTTQQVVTVRNAPARPANLNVSGKPGTSLFSALATHGIHLPSECGGGGTCGKCQFKANRNTQVNDVERYHLTAVQLNEGIRLGCQQPLANLDEVEIL